MNYGVAIGANRPQIGNWVNFVSFSHRGKRAKMVDVNDVTRDFAVNRPKAHAANIAGTPVVRDTCIARCGVAFIRVYGDLVLSTLRVLGVS